MFRGNSKNSLSETEFYKYIAKKFELIETYGSDFHDPKTEQIGIEIGSDNHEEISKSMVLKRQI